MNARISIQKPWLALTLLSGEYALLGWYLAAHHLFWLVGTCIVALTFTFIWKKNPILDFLAWFANQQVLTVIAVSFLLSLLIAFLLINPVLLSLSLLPTITLLYAVLEMRMAAFKQVDVLIWAVMVTGFGLTVGEIIDLFITPSMRY